MVKTLGNNPKKENYSTKALLPYYSKKISITSMVTPNN
jgi:hypothetical protein